MRKAPAPGSDNRHQNKGFLGVGEIPGLAIPVGFKSPTLHPSIPDLLEIGG
jgi:hypothetical protein